MGQGETPVVQTILAIVLGIALVIVLGILALQFIEYQHYSAPQSAWPEAAAGPKGAAAPILPPLAAPAPSPMDKPAAAASEAEPKAMPAAAKTAPVAEPAANAPVIPVSDQPAATPPSQ